MTSLAQETVATRVAPRWAFMRPSAEVNALQVAKPTVVILPAGEEVSSPSHLTRRRKRRARLAARHG